MSWQAINLAYDRLAAAVDDGSPLAGPWADYCAAVQSSVPPYHLLGLLEELAKIGSGKPTGSVPILDHGCGGCWTLIYLAARGYTDIRGVDVAGSNCERWNRLTAEVFGMADKRFHEYDGTLLPFPDGSVDLVFSQQVLEHVHPDVLERFYAEEHRVLRNGGVAVHGVPHRLVPYDSHTRTWLLHWFLPRPAWIKVLRLLGCNVATAETALFLRWPWTHMRMARRHFGHCEDRTGDRLRRQVRFEYYDGPVGLRRMLAWFANLPGVGGVIRGVLKHFMLLDTVSVNSFSRTR
jgi:SAM-dependent methyltransferase